MDWLSPALTGSPSPLPSTEQAASGDSLGSWISVVIAVLAAAFAGWQAFEARKARLNAVTAQTAAEDAATKAAGAQEQSAASLAEMAQIAKEQHEAAKAAAAKKPDPWTLKPGSYRKNGEAMLLELGGSDPVTDVSLKFERAPRMLHLDPERPPETMRPGDAIEIYWMKTMGDSSTFVIEVHWTREGETEKNVTRATLS